MSEKNIRGITVDLDINNNKMIRKLNAISKHTKALAEELSQIDNNGCPNCGGEVEVTTMYSDSKQQYQTRKCLCCNYKNEENIF